MGIGTVGALMVSLDGAERHKKAAPATAGVTPRYREWSGEGSLVAFVVSENLHRRHLTAAQRAAVGTDMLPLVEAEAKERMVQGAREGAISGHVNAGHAVKERTGGKEAGESEGQVQSEVADDNTQGRAKLPYPGKASEHVAQVVGVSPRYVSDAKRVKERAPEAFERMKEGTVSMTQAQTIVRAPDEERPRLTMVAYPPLCSLPGDTYMLCQSPVVVGLRRAPHAGQSPRGCSPYIA